VEITLSSKREAELKSAFTAEMKMYLPGFLMLQFATAGAPDRAIVGYGRTTMWEFKHGTPGFMSQGLQELMCMRLAAAGHCRYVIWQEHANGNAQRTLIVHPKVINERKGWALVPEAWCAGYDMKWLVGYIQEEHRTEKIL
jgi:hypothetical protein